MITIAATAVAAGVAATVWTVWLRCRFVVVMVRGPSMEPTLREGERVLVRRRPLSRVRSGEIVVFSEVPDLDTLQQGANAGGPWGKSGQVRMAWLVKRAVAVPGDPVPRTRVAALANADHDQVPAGSMVVVGDNTEISGDSRRYGYVRADRLVGVVLRKL